MCGYPKKIIQKKEDGHLRIGEGKGKDIMVPVTFIKCVSILSRREIFIWIQRTTLFYVLFSLIPKGSVAGVRAANENAMQTVC